METFPYRVSTAFPEKQTNKQTKMTKSNQIKK